MNKTTFFGIASAAALCASMTLVAQDVQEASAPSPEALARMAPGPMHAKLEPLLGTWEMKGKWRMTPDAPWEEFEAVAEREWILDGRFIQETVTSEFMGQDFEGIGLMGYDNTREEFTMVWIDNMQTGTGMSTGQMRGRTFTFQGEASDAMSGEKNRWNKSVLELGEDKHVYKGFMKDADGAEFLSMEMTGTPE